MIGSTYLGRITNDYTTTDIIIMTGEELPENEEFMALELCKQPTDRHFYTTIMIARKPNDPSLPLHKVGMTFPLKFHRTDCVIGECDEYAHTQPKELEQFRIGGASCEFCSKRKERLMKQKLEDTQETTTQDHSNSHETEKQADL